VWRTDGQIELHEVTIEARRTTRESLQQREAAARAICQQRDWCYVIHTDETLPSGYEYTNLDFLSAFRASAYADAEITTWWLERMAAEESVHPPSILAGTEAEANAGPFLNGLYYLLWHGMIHMDWHRPFVWRGALHPAARIWLPMMSLADFQPQCTACGLEQTKEVC
jgi:hypothetical protein